MERILLLEDDIALGQGIAMALQIPNIEIAVCRTLGEARRALAETAFVLLILDVNLPDGSGLDLLREQKALRPELPVILLTANDLELDEVAGLESGADDYITKPFSLAVLRARVNARLRRPGVARRGELALPPFVFDFERMVYRKHGAAIELTALLFSSLFTIAFSVNEGIQQTTFRQVGSFSHGGFKYLTEE